MGPEERLGGFVRSLEQILPILGCVLAVDLTDKRAHRGAELRDTAGYSALYRPLDSNLRSVPNGRFPLASSDGRTTERQSQTVLARDLRSTY